jgi:N-acetylmuramoyl-L-alanine amidase
MKLKLNKLGMKSNGVRQGQFLVMWRATMPNILVEVGYTSNKQEAQLLVKESAQQKIAEAIFLGIKKYKEDVEGAI